MTLESDAGDIPLGLHSKTLKMTFNLGFGTIASASYLREALLKGTFNSNFPLDNSFQPLYFMWTAFECFNTFILYKAGEIIFIGCQKFSAENELEITKLSPVIKFSVEAYDIIRCIGEMIRPEAWTWFLKTENVAVDYGMGDNLNVIENKEYKVINIAKHFFQGDISENFYGTYYSLEDRLTGDMAFTVQTFERLAEKIGVMFASYLRAILVFDAACEVSTFFNTSTSFYKQREYGANPSIIVAKPSFISEVISTKFNQNFFHGQIIGGALVDEKMFGQFKNFYEVLKSLIEGSFEQYRMYFTYNNYGSGMSSDSFHIQLQSLHITPTITANVTINQNNVYDSVKFKLFQETLNTCNVTVSSITGDADTESWSYSKQATSGDNSKDIKVMFHNIPLLTYRNVNNQESDQEENTVWFRNTVNAGYICYLDSDGIPSKVDTACTVSWVFDYWFNNTSTDVYKAPFLQILTEQQKSGLPYNIAYSAVTLLGDARQKMVEFRTTNTAINSDDIGLYAFVNIYSLNPILGNWGGTGAVNNGAIMKHTLNIWTGMADVILRIHGMIE